MGNTLSSYFVLPSLSPFALTFPRRHSDLQHVSFLNSNFRNAIADASRSHKFLLCYIHSSEHPNTASVLTTLFTSETLSSYIQEHFVLWGCDVLEAEGMKLFLQLGGTTFPFFAVLMRAASKDQVVVKLQGQLTPDAVLRALRQCVQENGAAFIASRADALESQERQRLRDIQAEELRAALEEDQRKEMALKQERERVEREQRELREKEELAKKKEEEDKMKLLEMKAIALSRIVDEPSPNEAGCITTRIILLDGSFIERRFRASDAGEAVYDYITVQEKHVVPADKAWEVVTKAPPIQVIDKMAPLAAANLPARAVLVVRCVQ